MAGEIVHIELKSSDFAKSAAFYEKLFGWRTDGVQSGGHLMFETAATNGAGGAPAVQGSWIRSALAQAPGPVAFVAVDDLEASLAVAEQEGGRVLVRRLALGGRGTFGLIADPDGNVVGLLAHRSAAPASKAPAAGASSSASGGGEAVAAAEAATAPAGGKAAKAAKAPAKKAAGGKRAAKR